MFPLCSSPTRVTSISPEVELWILRLLVKMGGYKHFVTRTGFIDDGVAAAIGLGDWIDPEEYDFDPPAVITLIKRRHRAAETRAKRQRKVSPLRRNMERLATVVGLSPVESHLLEFAVMLHHERVLDNMVDLLGQFSTADVIYCLATVLALPESEVRVALNPRSALSSSGLLTLQRDGAGCMSGKLDLLSSTLPDLVLSDEREPRELLRGLVNAGHEPTLTIDDFGHLASDVALIKAYLNSSIAAGVKGVNVLLYGPPGTGKTELARLLAQELGCDLFEVASEDEQGDPISGEKRLRAFQTGQAFFANHQALMLFDEVEDVFGNGLQLFGRSAAQTNKGAMTRWLEENPIPGLWLCNSVDAVDAAFVRRFDIVTELPIPPRAVRERIITEAGEGYLQPDQVTRLAKYEMLAPAVVTRAARVVAAVSGEFERELLGATFEGLVRGTLKAQGHTVRRPRRTTSEEFYDPAMVNADTDVERLAAGLAKTETGRLCFYGPPGTGKTAFAHWLADLMGKPLLKKRASDLLSKYVGETEQLLAAAFDQAERDEAVLLIDEVDGFLQSRQSAVQHYESSMVNEMLTQLESFDGIFIATTNLLDTLDSAALRRFDFKVRFDKLRTEQVCQLFERYCEAWQLAKPGDQLMKAVAALERVTLGDFHVAGRQRRIQGFGAAEELLQALVGETEARAKKRHGIGFVQSSD